MADNDELDTLRSLARHLPRCKRCGAIRDR